jgi:hypothetical protein
VINVFVWLVAIKLFINIFFALLHSSASSRPAADYPSTVGGYDGRGILNPITGQVVNYRSVPDNFQRTHCISFHVKCGSIQFIYLFVCLFFDELAVLNE